MVHRGLADHPRHDVTDKRVRPVSRRGAFRDDLPDAIELVVKTWPCYRVCPWRSPVVRPNGAQGNVLVQELLGADAEDRGRHARTKAHAHDLRPRGGLRHSGDRRRPGNERREAAHPDDVDAAIREHQALSWRRTGSPMPEALDLAHADAPVERALGMSMSASHTRCKEACLGNRGNH